MTLFYGNEAGRKHPEMRELMHRSVSSLRVIRGEPEQIFSREVDGFGTVLRGGRFNSGRFVEKHMT